MNLFRVVAASRMRFVLSFVLFCGAIGTAPADFLSFTSPWKFTSAPSDSGVSWKDPAFDDSDWQSGPGLFYNETAVLPVPKATLLPLTNALGEKIVTYYFRARFQWTGDTSNAALTLRMLLDDGAVIYLNGIEVARIRVSMRPETVARDSYASSTVRDATNYETISLPVAPLRSGENLIAVEVHQADDSENDVVFGAALGENFPVALPDLIMWGDSALPHVGVESFSAGSCEILEGCISAGIRTVLRFNAETRNIGTADLHLGNPVGNPLFKFDRCHGHFHYDDYAAYRLRDADGVVVADGGKIGFCLLDGFQWDPAANSTPIYDCENQGIRAGWADVYAYNLPCQWIDITGVPPGTYTLEIEVDPSNRILESDEFNNLAAVTVVIEPPCQGPPANDDFSAAQPIAYAVQTLVVDTDCATKQLGEPDHADSTGGHSVWYRWTAPTDGLVTVTTDGSNFDTVLAAYRGPSMTSLGLITDDDDDGEENASRIVLNGRAGEVYHFAVDGYGTAAGDAVLNINPGENDAFARCLSLSGASGSVGGYSKAASKETIEPNHAGKSGGCSIWFCWTATQTGPVELSTASSRFDTLLAVYTGSAINSLNLVASDDNGLPGNLSRVIFLAVNGTSYRIAVDGVDGTGGVFFLNWRPLPRSLSVQRLANDTLQLQILGTIGDRCLVEISSDLSSWQLWRGVTNTSGSIQLLDSLGSAPNRFFRLRDP